MAKKTRRIRAANPFAAAIRLDPLWHKRVVRDRTQYRRTVKHRGKGEGGKLRPLRVPP